MGLIKLGVFLAAGLFLLPSPPDDQAPQAPTGSYLWAASSTAYDLGSFCERQPQVCSVAGSLASLAQRKVKYSVRLISEWAEDDQLTSRTPASSPPNPTTSPAGVAAPPDTQVEEGDPIVTGSLLAEDGQSTLKIDDLIPPWIGPRTQKG